MLIPFGVFGTARAGVGPSLHATPRIAATLDVRAGVDAGRSEPSAHLVDGRLEIVASS
jgi:hypothetical protein